MINIIYQTVQMKYEQILVCIAIGKSPNAIEIFVKGRTRPYTFYDDKYDIDGIYKKLKNAIIVNKNYVEINIDEFKKEI